MLLSTRKVMSVVAFVLLCLVACIPSDDCGIPPHYIYRGVTYTGLRDTMRVGDTIHVALSFPWINTSTANGLTYDVRDSELPMDNSVGVFCTRAPVGRRDSIADLYGGSIGTTPCFNPTTFVPETGTWVLGGTGASVYGDSTAQGWSASGKIILSTPGRTYITFRSFRESNDRRNGEGADIYTDDLTRDGCQERVVITQVPVGYASNQTMIERLESQSEVRLQPSTSGVDSLYGAVYVLVLE